MELCLLEVVRGWRVRTRMLQPQPQYTVLEKAINGGKQEIGGKHGCME